jgi:hypothetical protein
VEAQNPEATSTEEDQRLVAVYAELAAMTKPLCVSQCRVKMSCCSPEYCEMAMQIAKEEWGIELAETGHDRLPLMGPDGCTAPPHVRPLCTAHVCEGTLMRQKLDFQERYFKLRDQINVMEMKRMERHGRL